MTPEDSLQLGKLMGKWKSKNLLPADIAWLFRTVAQYDKKLEQADKRAEELEKKVRRMMGYGLKRELEPGESPPDDLDEWDLSVRLANALWQVKVTRLSEVTHDTIKTLLRTKNVGKATMRELRGLLEASGRQWPLRREGDFIPDLKASSHPT